MGLVDLFKKKPPVDADLQRREPLNRFGRITDGTITDSEENEQGEIVFYVYSVNGADYESSERLNEQQRLDPLKYAPGAKIGVRYDPKYHGNSILV